MRKALLFLLLLLLVLPLCGLAANAEYDANQPDRLASSNLRAQSAIVIEMDTGEVIFEKNANDVRAPASTTKIMTVLLGIMMGDPESIVTVSQYATMVPEDCSKVPLVAGEQLKLSDLLRATMVSSGNDGAIAIAEHISGSEGNFVALMNEAAARFGATNTRFNNSHGYTDEYHYSTARDLAVIMQAAMENETFREIAALTSYTLERNEWSPARRMTAQNQVLVQQGEDNEFYYPAMIAGKTGTTTEAGYCFVGAANRDGVQLISVVLKDTRAGRWTDTKRLMEYGFTQYVSTSVEMIYRENPKAIEISGFDLEDPDRGRLELSIRKLNPTADDHLVGFAGKTDSWMRVYNMRTTVSYLRKLEAPVEAGEVMGVMTYTPEDPNKEPVEYELLAARSIQKRATLAPSIEEIRMYTEADPNPFPRFSFNFLMLILAPVLSVIVISQVLYKLFTRKRKPKLKRGTRYSTRYYR